MADTAVRCDDCDAVILEEITDVGVRPVGSDEVVPFRRVTDYVVCPGCFVTFPVRDLIARASGAGPGMGDAGESQDELSSLERLAERASEDH